MRKNFAIAVLGSGISGLTCANIFKENNIDCTLYEKKNNLGGLISCSIESGNLFHRVGGHVFNTNIDEVLNWFWLKFNKQKEFKKAKRNAVIFMNKRFINYPIELNLNQLDQSISFKIINELIELTNKNNNSKTFYQFLKNNFGETLYSIYFGKYNSKIWNKDLDEIPIDWLKGKLPMIKPIDILIQNIYASKKDDMSHSTFFYPKKGGSQFIVNRLSEHLKIKKESISKIAIKNDLIFLNENPQGYRDLIFTGDVRDLINILSPEIIKDLGIKNLLEDVSLLEVNSTSTLLCECDRNEFSWVYLPSKKLKPHRMIMTGNFSELNNNPNLEKNRITCTVECSGKVSENDFLKELNKLPFNPKFIAYNYCHNSYIIHSKETKKLINILKQKLAKKNIFLCGRFAEWEYFNMDNAIHSAMQICTTILKK